ncbi:MAG: LON peptidase substrate-binding domain-containing protein [Caldimonas sp.]
MAPTELPLFPLQAVLFPGGLLGLRVFEARYLDLMASCLRNRTRFGVVALKTGGEVRRTGQSVAFESVGTEVELLEVDSAEAGILSVRGRGVERFRIESSRQQTDGLWLATTTSIEADDQVAPPQAFSGAARGLSDAIVALGSTGSQPFLEPHRFDDAGWVANRWCEILPITHAARQKLMELGDPLARLEIIDDYLRKKGIVP